MSIATLLAIVLATQTPEPAATEAAPRLRLAIMGLAGHGVAEEYTRGITETIATGVTRTGVFDTISPQQVTAILAYEKRKDALGACADEACYATIARAVKADHLISGAVSQVGGALVLNLILIDAQTGRAIQRAERTVDTPADLVGQSYRAAIVVLQPLLSARQGYLHVTANVPDANVLVNDELRSEGVGQAIALAAGPHVLTVSLDGFYASTADIILQPGAVTSHAVSLIPARETIEAYEAKAGLMRAGAYGSAIFAVGAGVLSAVMFHQASGSAADVEAFVGKPDIERTPALREAAVDASSAFTVEQGVYVGALGGAVVFGAAAVYLFLAGDDPDRYAEFRDISR